MSKCPSCGKLLPFRNYMGVGSVNLRFKCIYCNTVVEYDKKDMRAKGMSSAAVGSLLAYSVVDYFKSPSGSGVRQILLWISMIVISQYWNYKNAKLFVSPNQVLEKRKEYRSIPRPQNNSLKEQFKYKYFHKTEEELAEIIKSDYMVPLAKEAAKELLGERDNLNNK